MGRISDFFKDMLSKSYGTHPPGVISDRSKYSGNLRMGKGFRPVASRNKAEEEEALMLQMTKDAAAAPSQFDMGKAYRDYDLISGNYGGANPEVISSVDPSIFDPPSFSSPIDQEGSIQARGATAGASEAAVNQAVLSSKNVHGTGPDYTDDYADESDYLNTRYTNPVPGGKLSDLSWQNLPLIDVTSNRTAATTGFTPGRSTDKSIGVDEAFFAADPIEGRNLGYLDSSKGSFYDAYMAPQTVPSRMMSAFGPQIAMGTAIPNIFTAAKGVGKLLGRDEKTRGGSFLPSFSNIGRVSQGDRFANLMAAQHYADQGPEGWVQSDFVGNYNPLEGPMGYGNRMGSINQEEAHLQEGIDRAGGYDIGATIGDYLGGIFSGEDNNDNGNDEGGWLGRLF
jgi:hypothetical protein